MTPNQKKFFAFWVALRNSPDPKVELAKSRRAYVAVGFAMCLSHGLTYALFPEGISVIAGFCFGMVTGFVISFEKRIKLMHEVWPEINQCVKWDDIESRMKN